MADILYSRWLSGLCLLFCLSLLIFAAYLQTHLGLMPCPLCVLQRIFIALLGLIFLISALYKPVERLSKRIHSALLILVSVFGLCSAGRHVWLTWQPASSMTACSPTLAYMFKNFSINQTLQAVFMGSGDCARETYRLFNFSIPEWTFFCFAGFLIFSLIRFGCAKSERGL